eukprot:IDg16901t1
MKLNASPNAQNILESEDDNRHKFHNLELVIILLTKTHAFLTKAGLVNWYCADGQQHNVTEDKRKDDVFKRRVDGAFDVLMCYTTDARQQRLIFWRLFRWSPGEWQLQWTSLAEVECSRPPLYRSFYSIFPGYKVIARSGVGQGR